jgi:hypothetical protein
MKGTRAATARPRTALRKRQLGANLCQAAMEEGLLGAVLAEGERALVRLTGFGYLTGAAQKVRAREVIGKVTLQLGMASQFVE